MTTSDSQRGGSSRWPLVALVAATLLGPGAASCGSPRPSEAAGLLGRELVGDPGCALFVKKCSRCHEIDRVSVLRAPTPRHLSSLVTRMRLQRGSDIDEREGTLIAECLITRQFGPDGLDELGDPRDDDASSE